MNKLPPFHLAVPVDSLEKARAFYGELLGCPEGRSSDQWVDFDFFGHQLVCHRTVRSDQAGRIRATNRVDGEDVPVPHFGAVLDMARWESLAARLREAGIDFVIQPCIRFQGQPGEQATMFLLDPSGNAIEFKAFRDAASQMFAKQTPA